MKLVKSMSDRMLSMFAPKASAAANCAHCHSVCQSNGVLHWYCYNPCEDPEYYDYDGGPC